MCLPRLHSNVHAYQPRPVDPALFVQAVWRVVEAEVARMLVPFYRPRLFACAGQAHYMIGLMTAHGAIARCHEQCCPSSIFATTVQVCKLH